MRAPIRIIIITASFVLALAAVGCQSTPTIKSDYSAAHHDRVVVDRVVLPSLVTIAEGTAMAAAMHGGELSRNDPPDAPRLTPDRAGAVFTEIRHREHLRTSSGRPRDHSVTRTQTIERRGSRWHSPWWRGSRW